MQTSTAARGVSFRTVDRGLTVFFSASFHFVLHHFNCLSCRHIGRWYGINEFVRCLVAGTVSVGACVLSAALGEHREILRDLYFGLGSSRKQTNRYKTGVGKYKYPPISFNYCRVLEGKGESIMYNVIPCYTMIYYGIQ